MADEKMIQHIWDTVLSDAFIEQGVSYMRDMKKLRAKEEVLLQEIIVNIIDNLGIASRKELFAGLVDEDQLPLSFENAN